jgi:hypothetical protein
MGRLVDGSEASPLVGIQFSHAFPSDTRHPSPAARCVTSLRT